MHKLISLAIGTMLGLGLGWALSNERIEQLESGIERHLCFEISIDNFPTASADLVARCKERAR